jgi:hypothetical protein
MHRRLFAALLAFAPALRAQPSVPAARNGHVILNDAHFHITNYIQRGPDIHDFLNVMGDSVGRCVLFGIPLQQEWMNSVDGPRQPTYYLESDAPLYYYSFTDAYIAMQYKSLTPDDQKRFDPMITGFNPGDMYAADHIRRVLRTFPGVFVGIGEFTIHKEFVSAKTSPGPTSLYNPALDSILSLAGEVGLVVVIHNDMDTVFPNEGAEPAYLDPMKALIRRHPNTTIIWAHTGVGRIVGPVKGHAAVLESMLADPAFRNLFFDISWDETAKYLVASSESLRISSELIQKYSDRFLFGSDAVASTTSAAYLQTYTDYWPLWAALTPDAAYNVKIRNYERVFDAARARVRAWEAANTR